MTYNVDNFMVPQYGQYNPYFPPAPYGFAPVCPTPSAPPKEELLSPLYPDLQKLYPRAPAIQPNQPPAVQPYQAPVVQIYQPPVVQPQQYVYLPPAAYLPPKPILTQSMHNQTKELLTKAHELAGSILKRERAPAFAPQQVRAVPQAQIPFRNPIHIDLADRSWKMFNNETHVHHHYHEENKSKKKKDDVALRLIVGLIGLTAALATAFFVGKAIAERDELKDEVLSYDDLKTRWDLHKSLYDDSYQLLVNRVVQRSDLILQRRQTSKTQKIALLVFGFMAGGAAFAGAVIASAPLMMLGVGIGAGVGVGAMFKLGYYMFSKRDEKDAKEIDRSLVELQDNVPLGLV